MLSIRTARRAAALVSIGAVTLAPLPAAALATSAGDQQYVDPLNNSSSTPSTHHSSSSSSGSGSSAAATATPTASSGSLAPASTGATATTAASGSTASTTGKTLPFTGYDGGLAVALGAGLVAGGVLLRRRLASAER
jgi:hypothetical protein